MRVVRQYEDSARWLTAHWRYDLNSDLSQLLQDQIAPGGRETIALNLLELCGMLMTAFVTQAILQNRPETVGDPVRLRGDHVAAVSRVNRCGASRDNHASPTMKLLGRLETTSGWSHVTKHTPGAHNVTADGFSRWPKDEIASNLQSLVTGERREQDIRESGRDFFDTMLQPVFPTEYPDEREWNVMA